MNKAELDPDSSPAARFGAFLRKSREERGWTQEDLARDTGYSATHVSAVETGRRRPTPKFTRELDKVFGVDRVFANKARDVQSTALLEGFPAYVAKESKATELRIFTLGIVPGVLQTLDYARALARGGVERASITQEQADERVRYLIRRQEKLRRDSPPVIHVVLDESCLVRPVGGPEVMAGQLDHLIAFAALPHTVLQVAPFEIGEARSFDLPVYILTMPDRSWLYYAESAQQGNLERDSDAVRPTLTAYYQLQAMALSQAATVARIRDLRKELP